VTPDDVTRERLHERGERARLALIFERVALRRELPQETCDALRDVGERVARGDDSGRLPGEDGYEPPEWPADAAEMAELSGRPTPVPPP